MANEPENKEKEPGKGEKPNSSKISYQGRDYDRPNSFYDVLSINTLGGGAMGVFIIASVMQFFAFSVSSENKIEYTSCKWKWFFWAILFLMALILAMVREYGTPPLPDNHNEAENNEKNKSRKIFNAIRHVAIVILNTFLIISTASGLSAVSGNSWFTSRADEQKIKQQNAEIEQLKDSIIVQSPKLIEAERLEKLGFQYLIAKDFKNASKSFDSCEKVYPKFRCAFELAGLSKKIDTTKDEKSRNILINNAIKDKKYNYKMPQRIKDALEQAFSH